jgi:hypothetical protein
MPRLLPNYLLQYSNAAHDENLHENTWTENAEKAMPISIGKYGHKKRAE